MKRRRWLAAGLLVLLLSGCTDPEAPSLPDHADTLPAPTLTQAEALPSAPAENPAGPESTAGAQAPDGEPAASGQTEPAPAESAGGEASGTEPTPAKPTETEPAPAEARPKVLSMGLYRGPYPEDGSGEPVDSVAVILVENDSDTQLQFAELHYRIDSREALFRVSELPPGEKALVVEQARLVAMPVSVWAAEPEKDLIVYLAAAPAEGLELRCEKNGELSLKNTGGRAAAFDLIYKQRGEDGVFLGGIAYHTAVPVLEAGETAVLEAPHFTETSELVRVTAKTP